MYGLPQAGKIANDQLIKFLAPHGYRPVPITPGLWRYDTPRDLVFSLVVVDDFGIRFTEDKGDVEHLIASLEQCSYQVSLLAWAGTRYYCGLTLDWDYNARTWWCDVSMPGYIAARALQRFQHPMPAQPEHSSHPWQRPSYGTKTQYAAQPDTTASLDASDPSVSSKYSVATFLLFYCRAIDSTLLTAIGEATRHPAIGGWDKNHNGQAHPVAELLRHPRS